MRIADTFLVRRPVSEVWALFGDVPAITPCLPGAQLDRELDAGRYAGRMTVKLGPINAGFEGEATVTLDQAALRGVIDGTGIDRRGGSRGRISVAYTLTAADDDTTVTIEADVTLAGPAAQFGRTGLLQEMSRRLIEQFVTCLEAKLAATSEADAAAVRAPALDGASLLLGSLTSKVKKSLRSSR
ncbi:MAG: SRPBCC family protein [Candidatus Limnocylindrales bacterium]